MRRFFIFSLLIFCFSEAWDQITVPAFRKLFPYHQVEEVWKLTFNINRQKSTESAITYLNSWIDDYWPATVTQEEPADQTTVPPDTSTVSYYGEVLGTFDNPGANSGNWYWGTVASDPADQTTTVPEDTSTVPPEVLGRFDNFGEPVTVSREPADQTTVAPEGTVPSEESTVGPVRGKRALDMKIREKSQDWEDEWFRMDQTATPAYQKRCLSDKEFARHEAIAFLEHRETLKMYIRYIFRVGQEQKLITKKEAEKMRSIFWKIDRQYKNNFIQVEPAFLDEVVYRHTWNQPYWVIRSSLNEYAQHWYKFPPIKEKLDRWFLYYQC